MLSVQGCGIVVAAISERPRSPRSAGYDPPRTIPFLRRDEVNIETE